MTKKVISNKKQFTDVEKKAIEKDMYDELCALEDELSNLQMAPVGDLNIFSAVGLTAQETKHSHFLSFLMNPTMPHGFGNEMIQKLCKSLFAYNSQAGNVKQNADIIVDGGFKDVDDLCCAFSDYEVIREYFHELYKEDSNNKRGYCDIVIVSNVEKSVMIIENKTFSTPHDDQLKRYQKLADRDFKNYKKVFVFLTPTGDTPINLGGDKKYNDAWCIFDYKEILRIVDDLKNNNVAIANTSKNNKKRMSLVLEDYMDTIKEGILKESIILRSKCKSIINKYTDALAILDAYTDNTTEIMEYCKKYMFDKGFIDLIPSNGGNTQFYFLSKNLYNKLEKVNPLGKCFFRLAYRIACENSVDFIAKITFRKTKNEEWIKLPSWEREYLGLSGQDVTILTENLEKQVTSLKLPTKDIICGEFDDAAKQKLNAKLDVFIKKIGDFESSVAGVVIS